MNPRRWFAILRLATAVLGAAILVDAVVIAWVNVGLSATVSFLSSFTALSNIFAVGCFTVAGVVAWRTPADGAGLTLYRAANASYTVGMSILFLVIFGPSGAADGSLFVYGTVVLHMVVPFVALIDWLFAPGSARLGFGTLGVVMTFPVAWFIYTFFRGLFTQRYVYEFLDPALSGATTPLVMSCLLFAGFVAVGLLVLVDNRRRVRSGSGVVASPAGA